MEVSDGYVNQVVWKVLFSMCIDGSGYCWCDFVGRDGLDDGFKLITM